MFADLTGFTAMSDKLSLSGRLGAEELATVINSVFDPLLETVFSFGGDVIKFGGDAFLVLFRGKDHTKKAVACGRSLLEVIGQFQSVKTSVGDFPVAVHIGISRGTAISAIVGKRDVRYDHLFCGPNVSLAYAAADKAEPGEICAAGNCIPYLNWAEFSGRGEIVRIEGSSRTARMGKAREYSSPTAPAGRIRQFIIRSLWEKIVETSGEKIDGEHRPVTTMFVGIDGWYKNAASTSDRKGVIYRQINNHIADLLALMERYGGNVVRLDVTSEGEKALVLFGAPVLREDAPEDAVRAALELRKMTKELSASLPVPIRLKIGINSGTSYVGDVGGSYRREYTAMGKEVNLAARLMSKADWGEILVGPATLDAVKGKFRKSEKGLCRLKGLESPIMLNAVLEETEGLRPKCRAAGLIGREAETKILEKVALKTSAGECSIMQIFGEAGSGKSVLMEKTSEDLRSKNVIVLQSACFEHMSNTPLFPLAETLRSALGIFEKDDRDLRRRKLLKALDKIGGLEWEGLISRLVGYPIRTTPEIANLSESAKRDKTFGLLIAILIDHFSGRNGCIIVDDLHWADATSIEFLTRYVAELTEKHISLLLVSRYSESVPRYKNGTIIDLGLLDEKSSVRLFESIVGTGAPESFVREIVKTSGGNPFYLEEMAKAVLEVGIESWSKTNEIPDSVERVIMARIDRLEEMVKTTIRAASVIGRVFGVEELTEIFPVRAKKSKIPSFLDKSAALDITPVEKIEPVLEYGFKHILTREVAYAGFSFKTRRKLHLALAEYYRKKRIIRGIEPGLIGYQYENSEIPLLAAPCYLRAGREAARAFSNSEAVHFYSKVIELLKSRGESNLVLRARLGLGRVYRLIGEYGKSESNYRSVIDVCPKNNRWQIDALRELSEVYRIRSEFEKATEILSKLLARGGDDPDITAIYQNGLGDIERRTGDLESALRHFSDGLRHENQIDSGIRAQIFNNMGICLWMSGRLDEAIAAYGLAGEIYKEKRDLQGMAKITNNTGIIFEQKGNLHKAAEFYEEASGVFEKIGDRRSQGYCYGNLATNFVIRGLPYRAKTFIDKAGKLFESIGDREACAMTIGNLADWHDLIGDYENARMCCEKTIGLADALDNEELICETNIRFGRILSVSESAEALTLLRRAHQESVEKNWRDLELKARYQLRELDVLQGRVETGKDPAEKPLEPADESSSPEIRCGSYLLEAIQNYRNNEIDVSRASLMRAYRVSLKSDLVIERWKILKLYALLRPQNRKSIENRIKEVESRIYEDLDPGIALSIKLKLERWIEMYLSKMPHFMEKVSLPS